MKYGLDNYAPVDDDGKFTRDVKDFAGQFVFDANEAINKALAKAGALLGQMEIQHTYPHCWRCKQPIIFRSTEQWFISMEKNDLRKKALAAIDSVTWIPAWGRDRIYGMVENRPDWCISRQRLWGVPITMFYCKECDSEVMTQEILDHVVGLVREHGADVWFEREAEGPSAREEPAVPNAAGRISGKRRTSSTSGSIPASATPPSWSTGRISAPRRTCTSRGTTSTGAGSTPRSSNPWGRGDGRPT